MAGLFDEIVVVDTGSKDRTREIDHQAEARRPGRMVLDACPGDPEATSRGEISWWSEAVSR